MQLQAGDQLAEQYRIEKYVGSGGFGDTYRATDLDTGQVVALTLGRPDLGDRARDAFLRDASLLGRINSPHVAVARDVVNLPDGRVFLVRDWVEGTPLERILQRQRLEVPQALATGIAVARGLQAAHAVNVLHRDIKPGNIVVPEGISGLDFAGARLMDFGVRGELAETTRLTQTGQFFGTPLYMSPEQLSGASQSPASDIYGLGLVLFEMLYGRRPFDAVNIHEIMLSRFEGEITRVADSRVPRSLDLLVRRCLEPRPEARPQSADELLEMLQQERDAPTTRQARATGMSRSTGQARALPKQPSPLARGPSRGRSAWLWAGLVVVLVLVGWLQILGPAPAFDGRRVLLVFVLLLMLALLPGAFFVHRKLTKSLQRRRTRAGDQAFRALSHAQNRDVLTTSLAFEVDQLLESCRTMDQGVLEASVAILLNEVQSAQQSGDRQSALMNMLKVLDKITARLTPWYVRQAKLVAFTGSAITMLAGLLGAAKAMQDLTRPAPAPASSAAQAQPVPPTTVPQR